MKPFPGTITKHGGANGLKIQLDDAQKAWLIKWFPITENARIAKAMGVRRETVQNWESHKTFPNIASMDKLCNLYGCTMDDVFIPSSLAESEQN